MNEVLIKSNGLEARYEKYSSIIQNLTIMNDMFMRNVFKKRECKEYVLQVIMEDKELKVVEQTLQKDYKNLQGRSAILDCVVKDSKGKLINVEIQQENDGASPKRARYYSGLMDMNTIEPGQNFDELPESYVIFITREDILGYGLPIYHINRKIKEVGKDFEDRSHIIYVNAKNQEDTELGKLMHDLNCKNAAQIHSRVLAERVHELKETAKGMNFMCREIEKIYNEGMENGFMRGEKLGLERGRSEGEKIGAERGKRENTIFIAMRMKEKGVSDEEIADILAVTVEQLKNILSSDRVHEV